MSRANTIVFVALLGMIFLADGMITVSILWQGVSGGQSLIYLGVFLFLMNLTPYVAQLIVPAFRRQLADHPARALAIARLMAVPIALVVGIFFADDMVALAIAVCLFACATFISQQALETLMGHMVLTGQLTAERSARLSQAGQQLGVFAGNALAGILLTIGSPSLVFLAIAASFTVAMALPLSLRRLVDDGGGQGAPTTPASSSASEDRQRVLLLILATVSIGALGIQLSAYNFFVPSIANRLHGWTAADYGLISAVAGIGALAATLVPQRRGQAAVMMALAALVLIVCDAILATVPVFWICLPASFAIGFGLNTLRIGFRKIILSTIRTKAEAALWSGRSTLAFRAVVSGMPLAYGIGAEWVGQDHLATLFIGFGVGAMVICLVGLVPGTRRTRAPAPAVE